MALSPLFPHIRSAVPALTGMSTPEDKC
jgi:hypothetical protein